MILYILVIFKALISKNLEITISSYFVN